MSIDPPYADQVLSEPVGLAKLDGLRVDWIGLSLARWRVDQPTAHPFHVVSLVLRGRGAFVSGQGIIPVVAPCLCVHARGVPGAVNPDPGTTLRSRYLCLSGAWADDLARIGWLPQPWRVLPVADVDQAEAVHHALVEAILVSDGPALDAAKLDLVQWLRRLSLSLPPPPSENSQAQAVRSLIERWRAHPEQVVDLAACADRCGLKYHQFRALFNALYQMPPYEFLLKLRINQACRLLADPDQSPKRIAQAVGFGSIETFYRQFRRIMGTSPVAFREQAMRLYDR